MEKGMNFDIVLSKDTVAIIDTALAFARKEGWIKEEHEALYESTARVIAQAANNCRGLRCRNMPGDAILLIYTISDAYNTFRDSYDPLVFEDLVLELCDDMRFNHTLLVHAAVFEVRLSKIGLVANELFEELLHKERVPELV